MSAEYSISVEPARDLVRIKMGGFFTEEDVAAFVAARACAHAELRCGRNQHLTINDLRDMKIQAREVVDAFRDMLADPEYRSRRLAFVIGPTLARMQLFRALDSRLARCFDDVQSAEAWLLEGSAAKAA